MTLLDVLLVLLILGWLTGAFVVPIAGSAIHLLLLIILVLVVIRLAQGRAVL